MLLNEEEGGPFSNRPRLGLDDTFRFHCHPGVPCFNACCRDVNIVLTPYDCLRLRKRLGLSSREFLEKYTVLPQTNRGVFPIPVLKMSDDAERKCPFVGKNGCSVYSDRPWPCRMYPLGHMTNRSSDRPLGEEYWFLLKEDLCKGHEEEKVWTVREYMKDQGTEPYERMGEFFRDLALHETVVSGKLKPTKEQIENFFMALYDLDNFRKMVFNTSFLKRFVVQEERVERMRKDDEELLEFGFLWVRFVMFGEKTMKLTKEAEESIKRRIQS